ncbi:hypothetical protein ACFVS9_13665 [Streptomyces sp. NPDC058008]|uniref:hypothetical protein n=1 Tax=Streptomyces sp. NPDC058008 TaxID=3346303 RepID=UPI0036E1ABB3
MNPAPTAALRWAATTAAAGVLLLAAAPGAGAATTRQAAPVQTEPTGYAATDTRSTAGSRAWTDGGRLGSYRGIQGGNLCLLARCAVGNSGPGGHAGPSNTQGFNLCLLSACTVSP